MDLNELMCFAKVYSVVMGLASPMSVSKREIDVAIEALKKNADNRWDWTQEQKDLYKLMLDFAKQNLKKN